MSFIISGKVDAVLMHIEQVAFASKKTKGKVHTLARIWETQPDYLFAPVSAPGVKI